jgi:hypothetical protein
MKKTLIFIIFGVSFLLADFGADFGWQRRWNDSNLWNIGLSFSQQDKWYLIAGFNFLPAKNTKYPVTGESGETRFIPHSYYGGYTGYHWRFSDLIRPGIVFGIGWENEEKEINGRRAGYTGYSTVPYFGVDVHVAIFSFRVSNEGIGCGLNFRIGG